MSVEFKHKQLTKLCTSFFLLVLLLKKLKMNVQTLVYTEVPCISKIHIFVGFNHMHAEECDHKQDDKLKKHGPVKYLLFLLAFGLGTKLVVIVVLVTREAGMLPEVVVEAFVAQSVTFLASTIVATRATFTVLA